MKEDKIRKNSEFRTVYRKGKSLSNHLLVLYTFRNFKNKDINRIGVSVSKKVGKSVIRSRVKRLISESYRLNKESLKKGYDFVFIARINCKDKNYKEIEASLKNLFKKAGLY
ncbi:MAG: ribonuclease P protein component [Clostridium sp.]|uniref:Ribonuclease P protein component n=1 Tax=Clostridium pasteurianum BC1 TaxID=86416 RepID=R4KGF3_CLOPA|nr:ribonuclease P protein component [Clostridium pasteurianum]AGK99584.1 ribonuclease P protein component [Clostridium pasteurianum BC1]